MSGKNHAPRAITMPRNDKNPTDLPVLAIIHPILIQRL
jgi:hypothetical protein